MLPVIEALINSQSDRDEDCEGLSLSLPSSRLFDMAAQCISHPSLQMRESVISTDCRSDTRVIRHESPFDSSLVGIEFRIENSAPHSADNEPLATWRLLAEDEMRRSV